MENEVYLGLGTNLGDRLTNLKLAINVLSKNCGEIISVSKIYETDPWGFKSENSFYNLVVAIKTNLKPDQLLAVCLETELKLGRVRSGNNGYESRIIDVDILLYDDVQINTTSLQIPHPMIAKRNFVLNPLVEVLNETKSKQYKYYLKLKNECNDISSLKLLDDVTL